MSQFFTMNQPEMARFLHLAARQRPGFSGWELVGRVGGWSTIRLAREMSVGEFTGVTKTKRVGRS